MCVTVRLFVAYKTDLLGVNVVTSAKGAEKETRGEESTRLDRLFFLFVLGGVGGVKEMYIDTSPSLFIVGERKWV